MRLGRRPGEAWLRGRYAGPYLRDALLDHGVFVETLETATSWSNLPTLYAAVGDALRKSLSERGTPPLVMCHVSHLYRSGASLYYTFLARQEPEARARPVARGQDRRLRRDRGERRDDHPPPRDRARPRALAERRDRRGRAST